MGIAIAPITVAVLKHLRTHGTTSPTALKAAVPGLQYKTMGNLVQLSHVIKTEAGYSITPKGRAKLTSCEAQTTPAVQQPTGQPAAPLQALPMLSNAEVEAAITAVLQRARVRISLQDISRRSLLAEHIVRPTLTTMIQQSKVDGTSGKPALYRLAPQQRQEITHKTYHLRSGPRGQLSSSDYRCPELRRNPGLQDDRFAAFALPSRVGNRLHWPDGRITHINDPR